MLKTSVVVVRILDWGGGRTEAGRQVRRPQQGIHDGYGQDSNHEGGKRWLDSWYFVDMGGEGERRIKALGGWRVPLSKPESLGEKQWCREDSRVPF